MSESERHSQALEAELVSDPELKAQQEVRNGLRQFDAVTEIIEDRLQMEKQPFRLRPSMLLHLHRIALDGLSSYAGNYRPSAIEIKGSQHQPAPAYLVPELIEELCDYVNENFSTKSAIHLCAYVLWRLNWIHPFTDGNGRTSRAASYLVLCMKLGYRLPGTKTIPDQISTNKHPYYAALEAADKALANETLDLSDMENLLSDMLANQLLHVLDAAKS